MKIPLSLAFLMFLWFSGNSQQQSAFSLEVNYGLNGNFFVRSYDETGGPQNKTYLYKKNFLGTIGGIELKYHFKNHSALVAGFARSTNKGEKNYAGQIGGTTILINDFNIRHTNSFYQLAYERRFKKNKPEFSWQLGAVLASMNQQEISIENFSNQVTIDERSFKNSKLQELGVFAGIQFQQKIDTKIDLGLRIRGYYLVSVQTFEAITLTPTLTFKF